MTGCSSEACARLAQAQEALACLERALQIVDVLELSSFIGIRIQHAIDDLMPDLEMLKQNSCGRPH